MQIKKLIVLVFLGLFLFSFVLPPVSANGESIADKISNTININIGNTNLDNIGDSPTFAKILLFLLVTLIVYSIFKVMPFFKDAHFLILMGISIIVGILSIFFLASEEVFTILLSYGVLGITLTAIIPFILITVLTFELTKGGYGFFSKIVWIVFGVGLLFRWITAKNIGTFGNWAYPIVLILILILFIWEKTFIGMFMKEEYEHQLETLDRKLKNQRAKRNLESEDFETNK